MTYSLNEHSVPILDEDEDDWYAPPAQGGAEDPLVDQEYTRLASRYSDAGYREGITDGKLSTLQRGFDESFAGSVPLSRQVGNLRGRAAALLLYMTKTIGISSPSDAVDTTPSSRSSSGTQEKEKEQELRDLIRELGRLKRDQILPEDQERIAHERDEHGDEGYELDITEKREMEGLEESLERMTGAGAGTGAAAATVAVAGGGPAKEKGEVVLKRLEERLRALERDLQ